jgi:hypothetical protein
MNLSIDPSVPRTRRDRTTRYDVTVWDDRWMETYSRLDSLDRNRTVDFAERHGLNWRVEESAWRKGSWR